MLRIFLQVFVVVHTWTVWEVVANRNRCFVCVPNTGSSISDVLQMFPDGPPVPLCNKFVPSNPEFVRECPITSNQGCLTQTNGTHVTKTCTEVGLEDCKTANKIKYCYCKGDLCNKESVPVEATVPPELEEADDDEDARLEGSGSREGPDSTQVETSSETDLGIETIRKFFPTSIKSVILTTPRPQRVEPGTAIATATPSTRPFYLLYSISFILLVIRG